MFAVDLRELAHDICYVVGPARTGCVLLYTAIVAHRAGEPFDPDRVARAREWIANAIDMMEVQVPMRAKAIGYAPRHTGERAELVQHLRHVVAPLGDDVADADVGEILDRHLADPSRTLLTEAEGMMTHYLSDVSTVAQDLTGERMRVNAKMIGDLLDQLDKIGMNVEMIAINASIEAARSGPQGAGFAVIAREVHSLSTRMSGIVGQAQDRLSSM